MKDVIEINIQFPDGFKVRRQITLEEYSLEKINVLKIALVDLADYIVDQRKKLNCTP